VSDVPLDLFTVTELVEYVIAAAASGEWRIVTYANVHTANLASESSWFRNFINKEASAVFCDGFGLLLGASILGYKVNRRHRMTPPDFLEGLATVCAARNLSIYLLAGVPGVVELAAARLKNAAPSLKVHGHHGYFAKEGAENEAVLDDINARRPDIVILGLGSPLQERWLMNNKARLNTSVYFPVGACLDYYSGHSWRGPRWLTENGFEWLCRLLSEPVRLGQRYLMGNPQFLMRVILQRLRDRGHRQ
jgi:N-acetylglucosaminyldiphosphoundecaprenol N-acetyl-beta-D-mannosaminyltransferase